MNSSVRSRRSGPQPCQAASPAPIAKIVRIASMIIAPGTIPKCHCYLRADHADSHDPAFGAPEIDGARPSAFAVAVRLCERSAWATAVSRSSRVPDNCAGRKCAVEATRQQLGALLATNETRDCQDYIRNAGHGSARTDVL